VSGEGLESVSKALELLEHLQCTRSITVTEAARRLGVSASSAHRLLNTLRHHDFVTQEPSSRRYVVSRRLLQVAMSSVVQSDLRGIARAHLTDLSRAVPSQVWLNFLSGRHVVSTDVYCTSGRTLATLDTLTTKPVHTLASGKLFLSELPRKEIDERYPQKRWPAFTTHSICTKDRLLSELHLIRRYGYAVQLGENMIESAAVAVPVRGLSGQTIAAIAISGPVDEFDRPARRELVSLAAQAAQRIYEDLVCTGSAGDLQVASECAG
jgi:DNA-binding IclR family transcriptional regulator